MSIENEKQPEDRQLIKAPEDLSHSDQKEAIINSLNSEQAIKSGAGWFFWIAVLSLLNSAIVFFKGNLTFIFGLGITQFLDGVGSTMGTVGSIISLGISFFIALFFIAIGYFAGKRHPWAFIAGMVLYGMDGLVFLLVGDILGVVFHILALYYIFTGYRALSSLKTPEENPASAPPKAS